MVTARRLGHANASVTTRHYARPMDGRDARVAKHLDQLGGGTPSGPLWVSKPRKAKPGHRTSSDVAPTVGIVDQGLIAARLSGVLGAHRRPALTVADRWIGLLAAVSGMPTSVAGGSADNVIALTGYDSGRNATAPSAPSSAAITYGLR